MITACWMPTPLLAFDLWPEFQSVIDSKKISEVEDKISSEYSSDVLTFSLPLSSPYMFAQNPNRFELGMGSLSGKEFFIQQKLALKKELAPRFYFDFRWWDHGDYDQESSQYLWGLSYKVTSQFSFGLLGSAYHRKDRNDFGAEARYQIMSHSSVALIYFLPDFQKNKRTRETSRWGEAPQIITLKYQSITAHFFEAYLKWEPEYSEKFTDRTDRYSAERMQAGLIYDRGDSFRGQFQFQQKSENENSVERDSTFSQLRLETKDFFTPRNITLGWAQYFRKFEGLTEGSREYYDFLPYAWYQPSKWAFGFDVNQQVKSNQKDETEGRINLKYEEKFQDSAALSFYFTFDADSLSSQPWEGGGAHFYALF